MIISNPIRTNVKIISEGEMRFGVRINGFVFHNIYRYKVPLRGYPPHIQRDYVSLSYTILSSITNTRL